MRWNSWLTFSRKTLTSGTCQMKTIIWGENVKGPINRYRKSLGQKGLLLNKMMTLRQQCWQVLCSIACTTQQKCQQLPSLMGPTSDETCCVRLHGILVTVTQLDHVITYNWCKINHENLSFIKKICSTFFFSSAFLIIILFEAVKTCFLPISRKLISALLKTFFLQNRRGRIRCETVAAIATFLK